MVPGPWSSKDTMDKIIGLYRDAGHQVFISLDNLNNYHESMQKAISEGVVVELSQDEGALYGKKW